jgi:hypothetical protein
LLSSRLLHRAGAAISARLLASLPPSTAWCWETAHDPTDNTGFGDYHTIADAFLKKVGFIGSGHIKVDSKKGKAETLDGRLRSKNKCKEFEQMICANN